VRKRPSRPSVRSIGLHIEHPGANNAAKVEAVVLVEVLVLGARKVLSPSRHAWIGLEPALGGVFGNQRSVAGWTRSHTGGS